MQYDVIIVGAGIAGLYAALNLPKNLKVLILCKDQPWECNTFYAQGGIAVAIQAELGIPVKYIGVGETIEDLQKFDSEEFVNALFYREEEWGQDSHENGWLC